MNKIPFESIAVFLFVFTIISNGCVLTPEEVEGLRRNCWNSIQTYFNSKENNSNAQARYAWDKYTLTIVERMEMPIDAKDFYKSFKNNLIISYGYEATTKYCNKQNRNEKGRCNRNMKLIFGGSPKYHTNLIMFHKTKAMLSLVDENGQKVFGDYMIPYWNHIRTYMFVNELFRNAQEFCDDRYKEVGPVEPMEPEEQAESVEQVGPEIQVEPELLNLFPTSSDLGNKV